MARRYGRSRRGSRCRASIPHGHWADHDLHRSRTPHHLDRSDDARRADERRRLPRLCRAGLGADARSRRHRGDGQSAGAQRRCRPCRHPGMRRQLVLLPPYSPDFNPIESAFAKFKSRLRKAAAKTIQTLETAIADSFPYLHTGRMLRLLPSRRIWFSLIEICSRRRDRLETPQPVMTSSAMAAEEVVGNGRPTKLLRRDSKRRPIRRSLRLACHSKLGARSHGVRVRQNGCPRALPACASVRHVEITCSPRTGRKNGC